MAQMQTNKSVIDPLKFLTGLQSSMRQQQNSGTFKWSKQQDAAEVLEHLLQEICCLSVQAKERVTLSIVTTVSCDTCSAESPSEENHTTISVQIDGDIQSSISKHMEPEFLVGENQWLCPVCNVKRNATKFHHFSNSSDILIIQIKRFRKPGNAPAYKSVEKMLVNRPIKLEICDHSGSGDVRFYRDYELRACVNHDGTLEQGHYWAHIKLNGKWYKCNDTAVNITTNLEQLKSHAYILFFTCT
jgi:ubiquitin C-terminal hydrolase